MIKEVTSDTNIPFNTTTTPTVQHPHLPIHEQLIELEKEKELVDVQWKEAHNHLAYLSNLHTKVEKKRKAVVQLISACGEEEIQKLPPKLCTSCTPISDEVCALVGTKVLKGRMSQTKAATMYNISISLVERIVQATHAEEMHMQAIALGEDAP